MEGGDLCKTALAVMLLGLKAGLEGERTEEARGVLFKTWCCPYASQSRCVCQGTLSEWVGCWASCWGRGNVEEGVL